MKEYQKKEEEGGSTYASDGALTDEEEYDSGVDQDHLKQMLDTDEQFTRKVYDGRRTNGLLFREDRTWNLGPIITIGLEGSF